MGHSTKLADADFIALFREMGSSGINRQTGMSVRSIMRRRRQLEVQYNITLESPVKAHSPQRVFEPRSPRTHVDIPGGIVLVGSDPHYWPGPSSLMHRAFCFLAKEYRKQLQLIVMNGDVIDAASISKYPGNWEKRPTLAEEMDAAKERLHEIEQAGGGVRRIWTQGNHDARFELRLASVAPEYAKIHGVHLKDHFPFWEPTMSIWINNDVVIKHNWKGGEHAVKNNIKQSGKSMVTGHLHAAQVLCYSDYTGTRFGVDTGTMEDPYAPQFAYNNDNPRDHRSGMAVLTFRDGKLMYPQLVLPWNEKQVQMSGEIFTP
jgi:hypothetical protein